MTAEDALTRPAICVHQELNLLGGLALMCMAGGRRLPVLRGAELIGILSYTDVFELITRS